MRLRTALPGALAAGAIALSGGVAGCGGAGGGEGARTARVDPGAAQAYVRRVDRAERSLAAAFAEVQDGLGTTATPAELATALGAFSQATARTASTLRAAGPPTAVTQRHAALVAAVDGYAGAIARIERDLRAEPDAQGAFRASAALGQAADAAGARIEAARRAVDAVLGG